MKKLTKIGASALAGSLVATAASAGSLSVSGTWEVTGEYTTGSGDATYAALSSNGNPFGSKGNLAFSGSGETDFGTASFYLFTKDQQDGTSSHSVSLDMGDMGTVAFDQGTGGYGLGTIDDKVPSAYEEVWNGVSGTSVLGAASNDTIGYRNTVGPVTVSLARTGGGTAGTGDGGNDGEGVTSSISDWHVKVAVPMVEGLTVAYGQSKTEFAIQSENDDTSMVGHLLYSSGPVSVGYRIAEQQDGSNGSNGLNVEAYSVAFNLNDEMSVSFATQDTEYDVPSGTNITETVDAINGSYTVGAASVRATMSESDNDGGVTGTTDEHMELSLILSF